MDTLKGIPILSAMSDEQLEDFAKRCTWRNYEANTGIHPLLYRPGANPYQEIGDIERATPDLALRTPNTPVDYVLLWSSSGNFSLAGGLYNNMQGFTRIGSSKPLGLARIYKRNPESN